MMTSISLVLLSLFSVPNCTHYEHFEFQNILFINIFSANNVLAVNILSIKNVLIINIFNYYSMKAVSQRSKDPITKFLRCYL